MVRNLPLIVKEKQTKLDEKKENNKKKKKSSGQNPPFVNIYQTRKLIIVISNVIMEKDEQKF